jgi:hypothetical protein
MVYQPHPGTVVPYVARAMAFVLFLVFSIPWTVEAERIEQNRQINEHPVTGFMAENP